MGTAEILLRTVLSFTVLLILTRLLGKKQVGQLTFFNYVTGITLGSTAAELIVNRQISILNGIASLALWSLLTFFVAFIALHSGKARAVLDGQPTIVIKHGKILKKTMASERLNMDDLSMLLRAKDIFSVKEVEYAILEPNGQLSVLKKEDQLEVTKKDLNIKTQPALYLPTELVVDGIIVDRNLKECNLTREWLHQELKKFGVASLDEIFYAEIQRDGTLFVDKKS